MSSDCQTVLDKIANLPNFSHVKLSLFMVAMYIVNFYLDRGFSKASQKICTYIGKANNV